MHTYPFWTSLQSPDTSPSSTTASSSSSASLEVSPSCFASLSALGLQGSAAARSTHGARSGQEEKWKQSSHHLFCTLWPRPGLVCDCEVTPARGEPSSMASLMPLPTIRGPHIGPCTTYLSSRISCQRGLTLREKVGPRRLAV